MTDWREAWRPTCGPLVDASKQLVSEPFPRGGDGVRALAALIDHFSSEELEAEAENRRGVKEAEDRAFVEQAGALLGLLLVDHIGDGALVSCDGAHRVRVGARGFVDPFAIIDGVLDADDPRRALAAAIAQAEAEAHDRGPLSRVMAAVERRLVTARPELRVALRFEALLVLDGEVELDLRRLISATEGESEETVESAARKLVDLVPGGSATRETAWADARDRLLPRLVPATFAPGGHTSLLRRPVVADVALALLVQHEDRARYVRADELARWGLGEDGVIDVAITNLAARSASARFARIDTDAGPLVVARTGDGLDAARLVLPGIHDVLAKELGSPLRVGVPHRDTLIACATGSAALERSVAARVRDDHARAPHRISAMLFTLTRDGLS